MRIGERGFQAEGTVSSKARSSSRTAMLEELREAVVAGSWVVDRRAGKEEAGREQGTRDHNV